MEAWAFEPMWVRGSPNGTLATSTTVTPTNTAATATTVFAGNLNTNDKCDIQIANTTTAWAYVNFGTFGGVTAATVAASYPVAPGAVVVVKVDGSVSGASVILSAASTGGTTVIFTRGVGV